MSSSNSRTLQDLLEADWSFLVVMISIALVMSVVAYFTTRRLGKDIERVNRYEAEQEQNRPNGGLRFEFTLSK